ncbi:minor capsid protein [Ralstonia pickettii]|uniref:minor capsid protein n=1 Tax=Ralstonia pickettii TaxID=329 RepID=UPI0027145636|nr:minor capsid protein [Ralstonia pickettii]WKZ86341.1 minor capsid protein [Ralstonia pickettii]
MNLMPLIDRLESEGVGTPAKTLFVNMLPAEATKAILLRNKLAGTPINHEIPGYFNKVPFQVIARARHDQEGEDLINAATKALTLSEVQLGNMWIKYMRPKTLPVIFPLSKGNLLEFNVEFECCFCLENA